MDLITLWFWLIVLLWTGFFVLEGFDFGVGVLARARGRDDAERGRMLATIGPHWDGNEVWLVVAVGAMFAAFPGWYAELLSTNYLLVVLILLGLIVRGVALEYRGKREEPGWRRFCDWGVALGSALAPFGIGVLLTGALVGGVGLFVLCLAQGYAFLRLTLQPDRAREPGGRPASDRWLFAGTTTVIVLAVVGVFATRWSPADLEPWAAGSYGLQILGWVTLGILPVVMGYQVVGYRVLRRRLTA